MQAWTKLLDAGSKASPNASQENSQGKQKGPDQLARLLLNDLLAAKMALTGMHHGQLPPC